MLNEQESRFQNDRPYPGGTETFGISAEANRELWNLLQRPEDRQTRTYLSNEMPASEVQRIFGNLPSSDAAPQGWAAIEPDNEPTELLTLERTYQVPASVLNSLELSIRKLRRDLAAHQEYCDSEAEAERMERQGQFDQLEARLYAYERETDLRMDSLELDLERAKDDIEALEDRLDERSIVPLSQRPHQLVEFLRLTAVLTLGIGAIAFIGAGLSGTPQQRDDLALSGVILATAGVFAATAGYNLD